MGVVTDASALVAEKAQHLPNRIGFYERLRLRSAAALPSVAWAAPRTPTRARQSTSELFPTAF